MMDESYTIWPSQENSTLYDGLNPILYQETYSENVTHNVLPLHYETTHQNSATQDIQIPTQQGNQQNSTNQPTQEPNTFPHKKDTNNTVPNSVKESSPPIDEVHTKKETRLTNSNIFFHGYGLIPKYAMQDSHLSLTAKAIYSYFCSLSGNGQTAFPSVAKICSVLNIGKDAYYNNRKQLIEAGYITIQQRHRGKNFTSNLYILNSYPEYLMKHTKNQKGKKAAEAVRTAGLRGAGYGLLPRSVMTDSRLDAKAKGLYAYFASFTGTGNTAFPSLKRILLDLNISEPTYYKCLNQLKKVGLLTVHQCKKGSQFDRNTYTLNDNDNVDTNHNLSFKHNQVQNEKIQRHPNSKDICPNHSTHNHPITQDSARKSQYYKTAHPTQAESSIPNNPQTKSTYTKKPNTINIREKNNNISLTNYLSIYLKTKQEQETTLKFPTFNIQSLPKWMKPVSRREYIEELKDAIGYEDIPIMYPKTNMSLIDSILEMMASVVCFGTEPLVKIGKTDYPREQVRERYLTLTGEHIQYVMECVERQRHRIKNIRSYYLVSLWNAPDTMELYYHRKVAEDLGYAGHD